MIASIMSTNISVGAGPFCLYYVKCSSHMTDAVLFIRRAVVARHMAIARFWHANDI